MRVLVTVKAYPGLGQTAGETVCVAGIRLDGPSPSWIRLWPVGFRELPDSAKFRKWQVIDLDAGKSTRDHRPESMTPDLGTIQLGERIRSDRNWSRRRRLLGPLLGQTTLCGLMRMQEQSNAPSLGLVKVRPGATVEIVDGPVWSPDKETLAQIAAAPHLLRDAELAPLKPPPYQVKYSWSCMEDSCPGHNHASCDWEVGAAAINWRSRYSDVKSRLLQKFGADMLDPGKDTYFFVGNQHQRPKSFLVLGTFYPQVENQAQLSVYDLGSDAESF